MANPELVPIADPDPHFVEGNQLRLLRDGSAAYPEMLAAIAAAEQQILLEMYWFGSDTIGRKFAAALRAAAERGVEVSIIFDAVGSVGASDEMFDELSRAGAQVIEYNPIAPWKRRFRLSKLTRRDHRKILVVDGKIGFTGGINIADYWLPLEDGGAGWRDDMVRIDGPAVAGLCDCFARVWTRLRGRPLCVPQALRQPPPMASARRVHSPAVRVLGQRFLRTQREISRAYLHYLRRAQQRIFIANSYFVPDGRVLRALARAARRGVDVRIIVPGQSDVDIVRHASRAVWGRLLRAGVRIFEWEESVLHAKTAVVDGLWSTIGTFNFDYMSLRMNLEVNVSVIDARFADCLETSFLEDFERCREVLPRDFRFRPLGQRLLEYLAYRLRKIL
ncbi:MAG TPA: phospholipase D-like domain-containing protein [Polyangiaceae bacterium]|nr:phospholipase D-like domain-containing protein [Polyangiaceae bacterium]